MTTHKTFKARVRARTAKTGESYTAARSQIVGKQAAVARPPVRDYAELAGMRDEAVREKTDRDWKGWVRVLDAADASALSHKEIAKLLRERHGLPSWWSQTVTVGYERIRGLRARGQRRGGKFEVNKSRTFQVPIATLYKAFGARQRKKWLGDADVTVRKAIVDKSMRITWTDGTPLDVHFLAKGPSKSSVHLQHREQPTKAAADRVRAFWTERLSALGEVLGS